VASFVTPRIVRSPAKINRQDFGVKWNKTLDGGGVVVGDEVTVTIDAELARKQDAPPAEKK